MKKYRVFLLFVPHHKTELLETMEWNDKYLSKTRFHQIIAELFGWAASGAIYEDLKAVIKRDDKEIMTINCKTRQRGSEIQSTISVGDKLLRNIMLAV